MNNLNRNMFLHKSYVKIFRLIKHRIPYNEQAAILSRIGLFSWFNYSGLLYDINIENSIRKLSETISFGNETPERNKNKVLKIAHIATTVYGVGGHTKVLSNWIEQDCYKENYVFLTNQNEELNDALKKRFLEDAKGLFCCSTSETPIEKAIFIREKLIASNFDIVVLHVHPHDVVPFIAINYKNRPKVLFYNHADHVFSIGATFCDLFIDFREVARTVTLTRRGANAAVVLPYPLDTLQEKLASPLKIKLKEFDTILLSMASAYKFKTIGDVNFFEFYANFLQLHPSVLLIVIGATAEDFKVNTKMDVPPPNMQLLGIVNNPTDYLKVADYFIEPYPMGTGLGLVEACRWGAFPIFNYVDYTIYNDSAHTLFPKNFDKCKTYNINDYQQLLEDELTTRKRKMELSPLLKSFLKRGEAPQWINSVYKLYALNNYSSFAAKPSDQKNERDEKHEPLVAEYNSQPAKDQLQTLNALWNCNTHYLLRIYFSAYCVFIAIRLNDPMTTKEIMNMLKSSKRYFIPTFLAKLVKKIF